MPEVEISIEHPLYLALILPLKSWLLLFIQNLEMVVNKHFEFASRSNPHVFDSQVHSDAGLAQQVAKLFQLVLDGG